MLKFTTVDVDLAPVELDPRLGGLVHWLLVETEEDAAEYGTPVGEYRAAELQVLPNALEGYGVELLTRFRITVTETADPEPEPVRPSLRKSEVVLRLAAIGKGADVMATLQADPVAFALWFSPDWPDLYKDDEQAITMFQAAGLTAEEIAQVLA
jgi:hypothetical protein